jgi:glycerol-3-phosphate dehydrogenase
VPRARLPLRVGMTLRIPGRVLFIVPWPDAWVIGTTDETDTGAPDRPAPTAHEVEAILGMVNEVLDVGLTRADVVGAFAGLRPLVGMPGGDTVRVSREHKVHREPSGLVRVSGGKYTTYRIMARDAVDVALEGAPGRPASRTSDLALVGAAPVAELDRLAAKLAAGSGLEPVVTRLLVGRHGTDASAVAESGRALDQLRPLAEGVSHLEAEVTWAVRRELALSLDDVLSRRMRLSMRLPDRCASIAPRVAALMGAELGWDPARQAAEVQAYLAGASREYGVPAPDPVVPSVTAAASAAAPEAA